MGRAATCALGAVALAFAWWATSLRPFTAPALGATVIGGVAALAAGFGLSRRAGGGGVPVRRPGAAVWCVLLVALAAWELAAYVQLPRSEHPTLSSLANGVLANHPARALALVLWLVLGTGIGSR